MKNYTNLTKNPEIGLLQSILIDGNLEALEFFLMAHPNLDLTSAYIHGSSIWNSINPSSLSRKYYDFNFAYDFHHDTPEKQNALSHRSKQVAHTLLRLLGNPWNTPAHLPDSAKAIDLEHATKLSTNASTSNYFGFDSPQSWVPPSTSLSFIWTLMFRSQSFRNTTSLFSHLHTLLLTLPEASPMLANWHSKYGLHPIANSLANNDIPSLDAYLKLGFDANSPLTVSRYFTHEVRSSPLSIARSPQAVEALFLHGADPSLNITKNIPSNLFSVWRSLINTNQPSSISSVKSMNALLDKHWDNPDKRIDQLVQSTGKDTKDEFLKTLADIGFDAALQFRKITDSSHKPTALAHFLSLDFPAKRPSYKQATTLIHTMSANKLLNQTNDNHETWMAHIFKHIKPLVLDTASIENSFSAMGTVIKDCRAFKELFLINYDYSKFTPSIFEPLITFIQELTSAPDSAIFYKVIQSFDGIERGRDWLHELFCLPRHLLESTTTHGIPLQDHFYKAYNTIVAHYFSTQSDASISTSIGHIFHPIFRSAIAEIKDETITTDRLEAFVRTQSDVAKVALLNYCLLNKRFGCNIDIKRDGTFLSILAASTKNNILSDSHVSACLSNMPSQVRFNLEKGLLLQTSNPSIKTKTLAL